MIELVSAGVLIWRLTDELRRGEEFSRRADCIATRSDGALLFVLAAYIVLGAGWSLTGHTTAGSLRFPASWLPSWPCPRCTSSHAESWT